MCVYMCVSLSKTLFGHPQQPATQGLQQLDQFDGGACKEGPDRGPGTHPQSPPSPSCSKPCSKASCGAPATMQTCKGVQQ